MCLPVYIYILCIYIYIEIDRSVVISHVITNIFPKFMGLPLGHPRLRRGATPRPCSPKALEA